MTSPHINLYIVPQEKDEGSDVKSPPYKGKCTRCSMSEIYASTGDYDEPERYEIRLKGHLDDRWADWFDGLSLTHESDGTTVLDGPLSDQAVLHGVFNRIRDLGVAIIEVKSVDKKKNKETNQCRSKKGV
jgi:hypothetical protein